MSAEVQDVFAAYFDSYAGSHSLTPVQWKAARAIINCRTAAMGAHIDTCNQCGFTRISYNSCRNRHCPKCQTISKEEWVDRQRGNLLNAHYFHVVFTVPPELNPIFLSQSLELYSLLFQASSETVLELCADKKYLGAKPGITAVLHTWGQNLMFHPHVHMIVTGGGLTKDNQWRKSKEKFFLPIRVLSAKFEGKFLALLREKVPDIDKGILDACYARKWVVYCKPPFASADKVVAYLGRYTHRVAISNSRIMDTQDGMVTFRWRDYADGNKVKTMTITAEEFIRRFLLHVLPLGFRKIRHYGLFACRDKGARIALCRRLTNTPKPTKVSVIDRLCRIFGPNFNLCPCCKQGFLSRDSPQKAVRTPTA